MSASAEQSRSHDRAEAVAAGVAPAAEASSPPRRRVRQTVLRVVRTQLVTPHMMRVTLTSDGFGAWPDLETDAYVKIVFAPEGVKLEPPFDLRELRASLPAEQHPVLRTYSIRRFDRDAAEVDIDFVVHGDEGIAGPWARDAQPGDELIVQGPGGGYTPSPETEWHLFVGDASALPAIGASIEALGEDASGLALIEVANEGEQQSLAAPAGVEVRYLHHEPAGAGETTLLADAVEAIEWPAEGTRVFAFVHGEREMAKAIRRHLMGERGLTRSDLSLSGYWARGRSEDAFQAEKSEPVGQIFEPEKPES